MKGSLCAIWLFWLAGWLPSVTLRKLSIILLTCIFVGPETVEQTARSKQKMFWGEPKGWRYAYPIVFLSLVFQKWGDNSQL